MDPSEFAAKWKGSTLTERAAAQSHFSDLCHMLGWRTPSDLDPTGEWFAFEKGAEKLGGGDGFADVWMKDRFAWEYKGRRANLRDAYRQLNDYREDLGNPPLLVVCDLERFEVHTNFTGTAKKVHAFTLDDLANEPAEPLRILRALFGNPEALRPTVTRQELTEEAAREFAALAIALRGRGHAPQAVAHFLDQLLFCMFAEDAGLLPRGIIERLTEATRADPDGFTEQLGVLFARMASRTGGYFGSERIEWFNGSLFDGSPAIPLAASEVDIIRRVAKLDWAEIEPAIFGTLFERGLDPGRRTQLGAHYTDRSSIERLVEPVIMAPLREEYAAMQARVQELIGQGYGLGGWKRAVKPENDPRRVFESFLDRLRSVSVLDPACGSGNFLYMALQSLKDLEREAIHWGSLTMRFSAQYPQVGPHQLRGIELNPYAAELARVTIWIGEIQWMLRNGFAYARDPILRPLANIETKDALIDASDPAQPVEAGWPDAEVIIGNPPFLGGKLLRANLGDAYVDSLFRVYAGRVPREADLVTYWHEKARAMVEAGRTRRVGLLATQGIRGGANRRVIERIKASGDLFLAWSDQAWVLDGAAVHISFLGYDDGSQTERVLDGRPVPSINANLTAGLDLTLARPLTENLGIAFMGDTKGGPFDIPPDVAYPMLDAHNPDGRSNRDVVRPWVNGLDITRRPRGMHIVDFGTSMVREEAALYQAPFEHVREHVQPLRQGSRTTRTDWWIHERPRVDMRAALAGLRRYIATPNVTKHRLFVWLEPPTLPDHQLIVFARDDDYTFGVLHSRVRELWARATGTQVREAESGFRYTPTTTFETFPFPHPTAEYRDEIAAAAARLDQLRRGWLDPPGASDDDLKVRTLTNLYNERPSWLRDAHGRVDRAVLAAYAWPADLPDDNLLQRLLALNLERSGSAPAPD
jgi:type II restriction/modification system DNA methylase subunit YeeA